MIGGYNSLLWIGLILILLPFIGVPLFWKEIILFIVGMFLTSQALFIRSQVKKYNASKK